MTSSQSSLFVPPSSVLPKHLDQWLPKTLENSQGVVLSGLRGFVTKCLKQCHNSASVDTLHREFVRHWKTNQMDFPEWIACFFHSRVSELRLKPADRKKPKTTIQGICTRHNHVSGNGCNQRSGCIYEHVCVLCGKSDHGAFDRTINRAGPSRLHVQHKCAVYAQWIVELSFYNQLNNTDIHLNHFLHHACEQMMEIAKRDSESSVPTPSPSPTPVVTDADMETKVESTLSVEVLDTCKELAVQLTDSQHRQFLTQLIRHVWVMWHPTPALYAPTTSTFQLQAVSVIVNHLSFQYPSLLMSGTLTCADLRTVLSILLVNSPLSNSFLRLFQSTPTLLSLSTILSHPLLWSLADYERLFVALGAGCGEESKSARNIIYALNINFVNLRKPVKWFSALDESDKECLLKHWGKHGTRVDIKVIEDDWYNFFLNVRHLIMHYEDLTIDVQDPHPTRCSRVNAFIQRLLKRFSDLFVILFETSITRECPWISMDEKNNVVFCF
jgi:hypothetical protein